MEDNIFTAPEVSGVLTREFIESRLHNDHPDEELQDKVLELQAELQGHYATPYYIILEPSTGKKLGVFEGADFDESKFRSFLIDGVDKKKALSNVASRDA